MPGAIQVLLVEDNPGDILLIRQTLRIESLPITLRVAMDGEQALKILAELNLIPDLVILDLNIPKISGMSLLELWGAHLPVVVFSSSISNQEHQRAIKLGAKEFVQKPIDLEEFSRRVSQLVRDWARPNGIAASAS